MLRDCFIGANLDQILFHIYDEDEDDCAGLGGG